MTLKTAKQRDVAISSYLHLCARAARRFVRPGLDKADLEQIAAVGLIKAYDRYDCTLQTPFEAYAWLFIIGELMHYTRDHERLVRPPRCLRALEKRSQSMLEQLNHELGRHPSKRELARRLNVAVSDLDAATHYRDQAITESLDDLRNDAKTLTPKWDDAITIQSALNSLSQVERQIVLGIDACGYSQSEMAQQLKYSRRHISRLHKAALEKMRPLVATRA